MARKAAPKKAAAKKAPKTASKPNKTKKKTKKVAPKRAAAPKKKVAKKKAAPTRVQAIAAGASGEKLGEITVPSGTLAVFDIGLLGYLPRPALEPAIVKTAAPADRSLPVIGHRVGKGRFADCWDHVTVTLSSGEITHSKKLGEAGVDFARLVCMDHGALDHWKHEDSLDGLADVVFWGRDAGAAARVTGAKANPEGYGWTNLSLADAEAKALEVDKKKAANHWGLAIDFRPHSHHFYALAEARKNKHGAGTIEVDGATVCLFFTSWGDGVFPIYLDLDEADRPVQLRVQLNTADSMAAMHAVNR